MYRRILCLLTVCCMLCLPVFASGEQLAVVKTVPDVSGMQVGAKSAVVMDAATGRVLFAQNEDERLPIASITKIMTALITLEQPALDEYFVVDSAAIRVEGSSMGLQEGDEASLRALAAGMLLPSGNDAANAAAVRISGTIPDFAAQMNLRASQLGMVNSSFETPSGLDAPLHYSTAYDMALLTRAALENEIFAGICSQYRMRTSFGSPPYDRWLINHNKLLNYYEGTLGVKTGFTKKAGRCLVSAAERDGIKLICVTLSCPDDWNVHRNLYDTFFAGLELVDLVDRMPPLEVDVVGGTSAKVSASHLEQFAIPLPVTGADVRYQVNSPAFVYAPVRSGDYLGEAEIFLDGEKVFTLPLAASEDVGLLHQYEEETSWRDFFARISRWFEATVRPVRA